MHSLSVNVMHLLQYLPTCQPVITHISFVFSEKNAQYNNTEASAEKLIGNSMELCGGFESEV